MVVAPTGAQAVGLGEIQVTRSGELVAYSLGSCVAICLYDPRARVAGMAHVVLPAAPSDKAVTTPGKFADTAVPALLDEMRRQGAAPARLHCKLAGGAAVLALGGGGSLPNIGQRNTEAVRAALARARVRVLAEETGGNQGRTVRLEAATGRTLVRTVRGTVMEL
jgi:chemotaxis protein CheD